MGPNCPINGYDFLGRDWRPTVPPANQGPGQYQPNNTSPNRGDVNSSGNKPSSPHDPLTEAGDVPNAIVGGVLKIQQWSREGADRSAEDAARTKCKEMLANSKCKGISCPNSCDVTYIRRFDPGGTSLGREFKVAIPRPCLSCMDPRPSRSGYSPIGGDGLPPGTKEIVPVTGLEPPIYGDKDNNTFNIESDCLNIYN